MRTINVIEDWTSLGEFTIESGRVILTDPCYRGEEDGEGMAVKKGQWIATVAEVDDKSWGPRKAMLIAHHIDRPFSPDTTHWMELKDNGVGVDSGQAGIFDIRYFGDEKVVKEEIANPLTGESKWYDLCCDRTQGSLGAGVIPFGCVSRSGIGDGYYKTYSHSEYGIVDALAIDFDMLPPIYLLPVFTKEEQQLLELIKSDQIIEAANWLSKNKNIHAGWHFNYCLHTHKEEMLTALIQAAGSSAGLNWYYLIEYDKRDLFEKIQSFPTHLPDAAELYYNLHYSDLEEALFWSQKMFDLGIAMDEDSKYALVYLARNIREEKLPYLQFWAEKGLTAKPEETDNDNLESQFDEKPLIKQFLIQHLITNK